MNTHSSPGGRVLFRDYAKSDMAQLRFNPRRQLDASGNLFARQVRFVLLETSPRHFHLTERAAS